MCPGKMLIVFHGQPGGASWATIGGGSWATIGGASWATIVGGSWAAIGGGSWATIGGGQLFVKKYVTFIMMPSYWR